jgi:hypothetical protein
MQDKIKEKSKIFPKSVQLKFAAVGYIYNKHLKFQPCRHHALQDLQCAAYCILKVEHSFPVKEITEVRNVDHVCCALSL